MLRRFVVFGCAATLMALSGCANVRGVTSDVSSFSSWLAGRTAGSYVFERLPSQVQLQGQDELEQAARDALRTAGFMEGKPDTADFNVQLSSVVNQYPGGYGGTGVGVGGGFGSAGRSSFSGIGIGLSFGGRGTQDREVSIVIRDRKTSQTLYESRAHSDGTGADESRINEAMFAAALTDFPNPTVNPRRILIDR